MARKASIRYWPSRKGGGFFTTLGGRQQELALGEDDSKSNGPVYRAAMAKWLSLLELDRKPDEYNVRGVVNVFRLHLDKSDDKRQLTNCSHYLSSFVASFGDVRVRDLLPRHVTSWMDERKTWNGTTRKTAAKYLVRALTHAVREGYIASNPLKGRLTMPTEERRGKEMVLPSSFLDLIEENANTESARLFLRVLRLTGARPIEIAKATAATLTAGCIVHPWNARNGGYKHKTSKTQRYRVIHLPPSLLPEIERLAASRPSGPIFRTKKGKPWTTANVLRMWNGLLLKEPIAAYMREHGINRANAVPYSYRHTFITRWIESGRSIKVVADLCGTSVGEIERTYGHISRENLSAAYQAFIEGR